MDERQSQIRERAGLDEGRINTEFLDTLQRFSTPVLLLVVIVSLGWAGYRYYNQQRLASRDQAFLELAVVEQSTNPAPATLRAVAQDYAGVGAVGELAQLALADLYLRAATIGVEPGTEIAFNAEIAETDRLDDAARRDYLDDAGALFRAVLQKAPDDTRAIIRLNALFGLAAVAASTDDAEGARQHLSDAKSLAERSGYPALVTLADARVAALDEMGERPVFANRDDLPRLPGDPAEPVEVPAPTPAPTEAPVETVEPEEA
ncbi:MAG: hypothetical protein AAFU70_07270, partial [Planctomycetota bacterium]